MSQEQDQKQNQSVNIANEKHGMTDLVSCPYYFDHHVEHLAWMADRGEMKDRVNSSKLYLLSQNIKILIYEGKTKEVYCPHLNGNKCTSAKKIPNEDICWLTRHI